MQQASGGWQAARAARSGSHLVQEDAHVAVGLGVAGNVHVAHLLRRGGRHAARVTIRGLHPVWACIQWPLPAGRLGTQASKAAALHVPWPACGTPA